MIKFYRKIRQRLLTENKFSKPASPAGRYLIYAIGEILLVIIGILIAVSINGWNEDRKLKIEEQVLLKDLKQEVTSNLTALAKVIEENEKSLQAATDIRALFDDREAFDVMPDSSFRSMVLRMNVNYTYDPRNGILNSIISSGKINELSDKELKYLLASLKEQTIDALESSVSIEQQRVVLWNSTIDNARTIEDGKIVGGLNWKSCYDHRPFRTLTISLFYYTRQGGLEEEHELRSTLEHIIELVDQNIEK